MRQIVSSRHLLCFSVALSELGLKYATTITELPIISATASVHDASYNTHGCSIVRKPIGQTQAIILRSVIGRGTNTIALAGITYG